MSKRKHWSLIFATGFILIAVTTCLYGIGSVAWENQTELWVWIKNNPKATIFFSSIFGMFIALGIGNDLS